MTCSMLEVCEYRRRSYVKIKMTIVLALELGCERLIYIAFVTVRKTRIMHKTHLTEPLPRTHPASATPDKTSIITVFRPSLLFKTGVDCWTVLDVSSTFIPWALLPGRVDRCTDHQKVTCE